MNHVLHSLNYTKPLVSILTQERYTTINLINEGVVGANIVKEMEDEFKQLLQDRFDESKEIEKAEITPFMKAEWQGL